MTRIFVTDGKGGVIPSGDKAQPAAGKMHSADVMHLSGDHPRAVGGDDQAQLRHRHRRPVLGQQPVHPRPVRSPCSAKAARPVSSY